jgi:hypothetical protein
MSKILSFEDYHLKNNEADLFGVTTSHRNNLPTDYKEDNRLNTNIEDTRKIDPLNHKLKLTSTDFLEFATLKDPKTGKNYIFYFDSTDPEFEENYKIWDERAEEYLEPDAIGIEAAANEVPEMEIGFGTDDWENGENPLVELDEELTDDMLDEFSVFVNQGTPGFREKKMKVKRELEKILSEIEATSESLVFEFSEEILESEGIHPAVREKLLAYLKDNTDATYPEAKKFIKEKIAGWNLTAEDFEEAKKLL